MIVLAPSFLNRKVMNTEPHEHLSSLRLTCSRKHNPEDFVIRCNVFPLYQISHVMPTRGCIIHGFGPSEAAHCTNSFDFTLLFEQSVLSLCPSVLFLLSFPFRGVQLHRASLKARAGIIAWAKLILPPEFLRFHVAEGTMAS